jgi:hypothetical protein
MPKSAIEISEMTSISPANQDVNANKNADKPKTGLIDRFPIPDSFYASEFRTR